MNEEISKSKDEKLSTLLRESRHAPSLPPRFSEGVWRRIEIGEAPVGARQSWIETLVIWAVRPRFALAAAAVLVCAGSIFGALQGEQAARHDMQVRYLSSVAPNSLR